MSSTTTYPVPSFSYVAPATSFIPTSINQQSLTTVTNATFAPASMGWLGGTIDMSHMISIIDFSLFISFVSLAYAGIMTFFVLRSDPGSGKMLKISAAIQLGARTFLSAEYRVVAIFMVPAAIAVGLANGFTNAGWMGGIIAPAAFLTGGFLSALSGFLGMMISVRANVRTCAAAQIGLAQGLRVAFGSGTVMAMTVCGFGLMGLCVFFLLIQLNPDLGYNKFFGYAQGSIPYNAYVTPLVYSQPVASPIWDMLACFCMGASSIALFARVAGGIYTKAADVGSDLVGKVEANIPEDDPRNPGVIADNVGDNVGDVAGMGADLFESYVGSIVAACTLGDGQRGLQDGLDINDYQGVALPFVIAALGIIASIIGGQCVRTKEGATMGSLLWSMRIGIIVASVLLIIFVAIFNHGLYSVKYQFTICTYVGLVAGVLIGLFTEYTTSYEYEPTRSISRSGATGPATVIIQGLGVGQLSTFPPVLVVALALVVCVSIGGVFGVALAAVGMLSTLGVTLATDAYGPVADNAGGIAEMAELPHEVRERTDALDALGNTTAATGKGFAIGSAVLTSIALMTAFTQRVLLKEINLVATGMADPEGNPETVMISGVPIERRTAFVIPGILIGTMLPFIFSALTMLAVGKSAQSIIQEVRRQFREIPGLLEGAPGAEADYAQCVKISTDAALRMMVLPGYLAIVAPFVVGLCFGPWALAGVLIGSTASGFLLAVMMANAGGAWDNAKKYVESGTSGLGGKGTKLHAAVVTGDTVGDPFKDTSGPSLNILIKLTSIVALVMAPLFSPEFSLNNFWIGIVVAVVSVVLIIVWQKYLDRTDPRIDFTSMAIGEKGPEGTEGAPSDSALKTAFEGEGQELDLHIKRKGGKKEKGTSLLADDDSD